MKITSIFADKLLSFHYPKDKKNAFLTVLKKWNDTEFLFNFYYENESLIKSNPFLNIKNVGDFTNIVIQNAQIINKKFEENKNNLNLIFKELDTNQRVFSLLSKHKSKQFFLRIYALKIDDNCFIITGGAIKTTLMMEDHECTKFELSQLKVCSAWLKSNNIDDKNSLFEFYNENQND